MHTFPLAGFMPSERVSQLIFACVCSKGSVIWARTEPRHATPATAMVSDNHSAVALVQGGPLYSHPSPRETGHSSRPFQATTGCTHAVLEVAGCQSEATWAARALPHKCMKRSSEPDLFIYLSGGSGILLRGRLGLLQGDSSLCTAS